MTNAEAPLLRSPPFPGVDAAVSHALPPTAARLPIDTDRVFASIRDARVGGSFWLPTAKRSPASIIVRARSTGEMARLSTALDADAVHAGNVDPWSMLDGRPRLVAHGDDEWIALAHIAGCPVQILSAGRFGIPNSTAEDIRLRVAQMLGSARYHDPFTGEEATIDSAIDRLADWRRILSSNSHVVAACGMAWWKRREIARFLWSPSRKLRFFWSEQRAVADAARRNGSLAVWPSRVSPKLPEIARTKNVPIVRIEDGFVRSTGLGSNLVPPSSVAIDQLGIHYDPSGPSDLETLLANADFTQTLLSRANHLRQVIVKAGISKYGGSDHFLFPPREPGRRLVLVPGQVEDDMSVRLGGNGLTSNLDLLQRTRLLEPQAEIWFRPHPDVDAGHRKGTIPDEEALDHADRVVRGGSMAQLLDHVDAVHVLTSLTGFEALMRGRRVTCHGTPFYAGWGLTQDLSPIPERRDRTLSLDQLVAAVLIVYPRYLDPVTGLPCPPETLIHRMRRGEVHNRLRWATRIRQWHGALKRRVA